MKLPTEENTEMVLLASTYDQSRFFKAEDLTTEKKLKIKHVREEEIGIGKDKEKKLVVYFTNDPRGLPLNRTNNRTLRGAFGDVCDGWAGKIIVLFPATAEYRGQIKPAMRVRIPPPKGNGQPVTAQPVTPPPAPSIVPEEIDVDDDLNDEISI